MTPSNENQHVYQGSLQPKNFPSPPKDWVSEWETYPSSDGRLQLYSVMHHKKEWTGQRVLVVVHGFGEHGGRYLHFPHYLQSWFDGIYCIDHRGHGRSEGLRGHVERFDLFTEDMALSVNRLDESLKKRFGRAAEMHLFGHSMGGLISIRTLLKFPNLPFRSASFSAPLLKIAARVPAAKRTLAVVMSRIWGSLQINSEVDAAILSHDQDVVQAYQSDRLVHKKMTPALFIGMEEAMADTFKQDSGFACPVQFQLPLQDQLVDSNVGLQYFRKLKLREKSLKTYPSFFHEIHNEIGKEVVFEDLLAWVKSYSTVS